MKTVAVVGTVLSLAALVQLAKAGCDLHDIYLAWYEGDPIGAEPVRRFSEGVCSNLQRDQGLRRMDSQREEWVVGAHSSQRSKSNQRACQASSQGSWMLTHSSANQRRGSMK